MYFDENNNYFDDYKEITFNTNNIEINRSNKLYSFEEGFNKGNLFEDTYSKYKNYVYKLNVKNDKDKLLLNIQTHCFVLKDLGLFLDTHPGDQSILGEFNKANNKLKSLKEDYENKYGPLCINNVNSNKDWEWINNPWPWDTGR